MYKSLKFLANGQYAIYNTHTHSLFSQSQFISAVSFLYSWPEIKGYWRPPTNTVNKLKDQGYISHERKGKFYEIILFTRRLATWFTSREWMSAITICIRDMKRIGTRVCTKVNLYLISQVKNLMHCYFLFTLHCIWIWIRWWWHIYILHVYILYT